jgi:hypothetical protein
VALLVHSGLPIPLTERDCRMERWKNGGAEPSDIMGSAPGRWLLIQEDLMTARKSVEL